MLWKHRCKGLIDKLVYAAVVIDGLFKVNDKALALHEGFSDGIGRRIVADVDDIPFEFKLLKPLKRFPGGGVIGAVLPVLLPRFKNSHGVGNVPFFERLFVKLIVVDKGIHVVPFLVKFLSRQVGKVILEVEIVKIVPILPDLQSQFFKGDPRLVGIPLAQSLQIVVAVKELSYDVLIPGQSAGKHEKVGPFLFSADEQLVFREEGDVIIIGVTEQIESGKGKLGDAVGQERQARMKLIPHRKIDGGTVGVLRYSHSLNIRKLVGTMQMAVRCVMDLTQYRDALREDVLARFLRYVAVHTTSSRHSDTTPSTPQQWDLARMLERELTELGLSDVTITEYGYVIARIPPTKGVSAPAVAFLAHMDTAPDSSGKNVSPRVWVDYDGSVLELGNGVSIDPAEYPDLLDFRGETIITADGTTLLGADDKAGVAEIMAAVRFLVDHPEFPHPELEIIFTPDEEIGRGVDRLDVPSLHARFAYTMDGGKEGSIEAECFSAYRVRVAIDGYVIHPGSARGKMANAVTIAGQFLSMVPQNESPEATDGRFGFYCPVEVTGDYGHAEIEFIIRDFELTEVLRRVAFIESLAETIEKAYPRCRVSVTSEQQYLNMRDTLRDYPFMVDILKKAIQSVGVTPVLEPIRGGTDGARLTEMGLPTPNVFAGGLNFHGPYEWVPLGSMERAAATILEVLREWGRSVPADTPLPRLSDEV